jgi:hypothetical protein
MGLHAKLSPSGSRTEARRTGKLRYIGRQCRCGSSERYTSNKGCVSCLARQGEVRQQTPKYKLVHRDAQRARNAMLRGYAPPPLERNCPPRPDNGNCASCGNHIGKDQLKLDHNHNTGAFQGWCCDGCNTGIGLANDSHKCRLRALYLERITQQAEAA